MVLAAFYANSKTCPASHTATVHAVHRNGGNIEGKVAAANGITLVGTSLIAVDEASVRDVPGLVAVVRIGDFVGVVAEREENAILAAEKLKVNWKPTPTLPDLADLATALRANPSAPRTLICIGFCPNMPASTRP